MISLSVAMDPKRGIGLNGTLPWHIKEELKLFKQNTLHHFVLMGRTTYEGLPKKLVGRKVCVVTNNLKYKVDDEDVLVINDLEGFCKQHESDEEEYIICGGSKIYHQSYKYAKVAYVSFVKKEYKTDTYFDDFSIEDWCVVEEVDYPEFVYQKLVRK